VIAFGEFKRLGRCGCGVVQCAGLHSTGQVPESQVPSDIFRSVALALDVVVSEESPVVFICSAN